MSKIEKVLFTGRTHTSSSARDGGSRVSHDKLDMKTSASGSGTSQEQTFTSVLPHPTAEQLFAAAWSACYRGANIEQFRHQGKPPQCHAIDSGRGVAGQSRR